MLCVYVLRICQTSYIREPVSVADTGKQTHGLSRHDTDFLTIDTIKIQSLYVTIQKAFLSHIKKAIVINVCDTVITNIYINN